MSCTWICGGTIQLDCLGWLTYHHGKFPLGGITNHSDILKTILDLDHPLQFNCTCNLGAKNFLYCLVPLSLSKHLAFPHEPIWIFVKGENMMSEKEELAKNLLRGRYAVLTPEQFDKVAWWDTYQILTKGVLHMLALGASKQVTRTAACNSLLSCVNGRCQLCLLCLLYEECTSHLQLCPKRGKVEVFFATGNALETWLQATDKDLDVTFCITEYLWRRAAFQCQTSPTHYIPIFYSFRILHWLAPLCGKNDLKGAGFSTISANNDAEQGVSDHIVDNCHMNKTTCDHTWSMALPEYSCT
ncbi:LOW QUALITY PROTEIN: hypothetical protein ACHAW6_013965 [Cyclotella cf. meneghiniana]